MKVIRIVAIGLSISVQSLACFAQSTELSRSIKFHTSTKDSGIMNNDLAFEFGTVNSNLHFTENSLAKEFRIDGQKMNSLRRPGSKRLENKFTVINQIKSTHSKKTFPMLKLPVSNSNKSRFNIGMSSEEKEPFFRNRRNVYSSMWAFASLNYLYADLVGIMDKNKLLQYQTGVVEGVSMTPQFLTIAAGFMQIPLLNVFLPQVIKNEKTLRWVQIASGTIMTLVQTGTLFVGKPTPYYVLFSAFEIAATTYITIDAIRWKANSNKKKVISDYQ